MNKEQVIDAVVEETKLPESDIRGWSVEKLESAAYKTLKSMNALQKDLTLLEQVIAQKQKVDK